MREMKRVHEARAANIAKGHGQVGSTAPKLCGRVRLGIFGGKDFGCPGKPLSLKLQCSMGVGVDFPAPYLCSFVLMLSLLSMMPIIFCMGTLFVCLHLLSLRCEMIPVPSVCHRPLPPAL